MRFLERYNILVRLYPHMQIAVWSARTILLSKAESWSSPLISCQESPWATYKISVIPLMFCKTIPGILRESAGEAFPWLSFSLIDTKDM
jgi:hypothetical protein